MSGSRQVLLGFFMALLSSAIVLGSLSLSLLEGGYVLAQAPAPDREFAFNSRTYPENGRGWGWAAG